MVRYKQEETPRYNGRDVAVMRARQAGALAVLGSATPANGELSECQAGRYTLITLRRASSHRPLADVQSSTCAEEYAAPGRTW